MKKTCRCTQCGEIFGTDLGDTVKLGVWKFCSSECVMEWVGDHVESLEDYDFDNEEDTDDDE